jgi:peptide/nickel transport system permease protein
MDELGRDQFSRILYGGRTSLLAALAATVMVSIIGLVMGLLAGYLGGAVDILISRVIDVLLSFPSFLLALAITGVLGPGLRNVVLAVVVSSWAGFARLIRSLVLAEQRRPYVETAKALGGSRTHIMFRHFLPNIMGPVSVFIALEAGGMLGILSAFSFLGLGILPPFPEWGSMLAEAREYVGVAPHMIIVPGAAIFLVVVGCNLVGDRIRDILDPRTRTSGS